MERKIEMIGYVFFDDMKRDLQQAGIQVWKDPDGLWLGTSRNPKNVQAIALTPQDCWEALVSRNCRGELNTLDYLDWEAA
jgi:hypothetical protein